MIGKAIHTILKDKIKDLSTGSIYPVIMPQNAKYTLGDSSSYPAIIYDATIDYIKSKDKNPNMLKGVVSIMVVSESYKTTSEISTQVRDVLDHYVDLSDDGLAGVQGFTDDKGYKHSFIENLDISDIFYVDEEDDYYDELFLYTRSTIYDIYYYENIDKFSYNKGLAPITNPLMLSLDCTQITNDTKGGLMFKSGTTNPSNSDDVLKLYNKLGVYYAKETPTDSREQYDGYLTPNDSNKPNYYNATTPAYLEFDGYESLRTYDGANKNISLSAGAMFIMVYKPTTTGGENYLLGNWDLSGNEGNIVLSHKKVGSDITLHYNPCGDFTVFSSRTETLITSTDSTNYWDADIHFIALSLGGNKAQTEGSYNQSGWYEYFNSDYNPKLTTGQIIKDNSFTGNSDTYSNSLTFASMGGVVESSGFRVHELLLFVPDANSTHNIDADAAPFQPTDIIYKKIKDYIYNKYKSLN